MADMRMLPSVDSKGQENVGHLKQANEVILGWNEEKIIHAVRNIFIKLVILVAHYEEIIYNTPTHFEFYKFCFTNDISISGYWEILVYISSSCPQERTFVSSLTSLLGIHCSAGITRSAGICLTAMSVLRVVLWHGYSSNMEEHWVNKPRSTYH